MIGVPVTAVYTVVSFVMETVEYGLIHTASLTMMAVSWWFLHRRTSIGIATHLFLLAITLMTASAPVYENLLQSPTLWLAPALPLAASFILGKRMAYVYLCVSIALLAGVTVLELTYTPSHIVAYAPLDWFALRLVGLAAFSAFAGLTSRDASKRLMQLSAKRNQMNAALDEAEAANRSKSVFLANMSHEIRNPMNGILGTAEYLRNSGLNSEDAEAIDTIARCGEHLLGIIDDILDFSKIESGELTIEQSPMNLCQNVEHTVSLFRPKAEQAGVELHAHFPETAPRLRGDKKRLSQVVSNLVGNAIKFSDRGSVHVLTKIEPAIGAAGFHDVEISVVDQGIGMKPEQLDRLFGEFEQVDDSEGIERGGSGLGLAISRHLVEGMGGSITVSSTFGEGSTFCVKLRLAECIDLSLSGAETTGVDLLDSLTQQQAPRVLVVDDQAINVKLAALLLEKLGCEVEQASDGRMAIEKCDHIKFDLIFMDIRMPVLSGLEAAMLITQNPGPNRKTPIVALTACAFDEDRQASLEAGMLDHLPKPLRRAQLEEALMTHLSGSAQDAVKEAS